MVELLVASAFVGAGIAAVAARSRVVPDGYREDLKPPTDTEVADLPCPWCRAATSEDDRRCPSCGQRFG